MVDRFSLSVGGKFEYRFMRVLVVDRVFQWLVVVVLEFLEFRSAESDILKFRSPTLSSR